MNVDFSKLLCKQLSQLHLFFLPLVVCLFQSVRLAIFLSSKEVGEVIGTLGVWCCSCGRERCKETTRGRKKKVDKGYTITLL